MRQCIQFNGNLQHSFPRRLSQIVGCSAAWQLGKSTPFSVSTRSVQFDFKPETGNFAPRIVDQSIVSPYWSVPDVKQMSCARFDIHNITFSFRSLFKITRQHVTQSACEIIVPARRKVRRPKAARLKAVYHPFIESSMSPLKSLMKCFENSEITHSNVNKCVNRFPFEMKTAFGNGSCWLVLRWL